MAVQWVRTQRASPFSNFRIWRNIERLIAGKTTYFSRARLGHKAESGGREAKVLGDLPLRHFPDRASLSFFSNRVQLSDERCLRYRLNRMCGRFTVRSSRGMKFNGVRSLDLPLEPRYNIAPGQKILVIADFGSGVELANVVWGLIPSWSTEPKGFINARAETLEDKPSFSESFQRRRS